jgi:hypothetical protein
VFSALTVLASKVVLLQALNSTGGFSFEALKTHKPGKCRMVGAQEELLSVEVLMEMFQGPHVASSSRRVTKSFGLVQVLL